MGNQNDFLVTFLGLFMIGYGLYCRARLKIRVGFKGMSKMMSRVKPVTTAYIIGGVIVAISSFLSWANAFPVPRYLLLTVSAVGAGVYFVSHLIGTFLGKYVDED